MADEVYEGAIGIDLGKLKNVLEMLVESTNLRYRYNLLMRCKL